MNNKIAAWQVELQVPAHHAEAFSEMLETLCDTVVLRFGDETDPIWNATCFSAVKPDLAELTAALAVFSAAKGVTCPDLTLSQVEDRDWVAESYKAFPPIEAGRFFIHGSHFEGMPPKSFISLQVDAATAFGSGEHETTKACLLALDDLARRKIVHRPLDMGCGTGILAMAMARLWEEKVIACDIDEESVRVTNLNADINNVGDLLSAACGNGFDTPLVQAHGPYDLIVANILMNPLIEMAPALCRALSEDGVVVLSGFLSGDTNEVAEAYKKRGLREDRRITIGDWQSLVLRR